MPSLLDHALASEMAAWESSGLRRRLAPGSRAADFVSNDYLGLAGNAESVAAARDALQRHGVGGRAARLLGGGSPLDAVAERRAAEWIGCEAALLFPSGYQANLGIVSALASRGDVILSDARNHASLIDAARLSRARVRIFAHNDMDELEAQLAASRSARRRLVLTEGIFSMDGDPAPLDAIDELCQRYDAWFVVDEAHSVGVIGPQGRGACAQLEHSTGEPVQRLAARMVTGGKALGVSGAFALASETLVDHLLNHARSFVYTTAVSPAVSGALVRAIELAADAAAERESLRALGGELARRLGLPRPAAAILPFVVGDPESALALARRAQEADLDVRAVRPPTVPADTSRLRIVCHAHNQLSEIEGLAGLLEHETPALLGAARPRPEGQRPLVVVGTDTDVGKTVVSALLVRALARRGRAAYWKPVQTGSDSDTQTLRRLAADIEVHFHESAFEFPLPASPHEAAAAVGRTLDPEVVERAYSALDRSEPTIVELAGGLLVPWTDATTQADWLASERPPLVLVARSGLGTLNHTLLTLEALEARGLAPRALFLVGPAHASNRATLAPHVAALFEVPQFESLTPAVLDGWLDAHDLAPALGHGPGREA